MLSGLGASNGEEEVEPPSRLLKIQRCPTSPIDEWLLEAAGMSDPVGVPEVLPMRAQVTVSKQTHLSLYLSPYITLFLNYYYTSQ